MLGRLLPRKSEFFALFSRHAELCFEGAKRLRLLLHEPSNARAGYEEVHALEHEADRVCQEAMESLHKTFVTPIERSDIHALSSRLDDIMDHIEATAQRVWLYEVEKATPEALEMGENLVRATDALRGAVGALAGRLDDPKLRQMCAAVKAVEKENDRVLRRATARLFKEETDARALIKWKEIYDDVERAVDRCEDVANVIEGVALENS
ncbi:MAG TPA: DUF47 family protein [Myxococcota bacterium]|nr:DUF47 family protein [Myxococcota bacterium]